MLLPLFKEPSVINMKILSAGSQASISVINKNVVEHMQVST